MKLTKNLLETLAGVMATKTTEVSPKGNYIPRKEVVTEAYKESLAAHELPSHVKDAVKKVHAVLRKHKVQGAHVSVAHHDYEPKHEKASGGHHEINIQVGRHHIDNDDLVSDLHQTQPHKWHHHKGDVAIAPCASIHPSPRHNLHEEVEAEQLDEAGRYLHRGESQGRHYKDEHGVTWDDEGHNSAGTGPSDRAYHHAPKHKYPPKQKHYHAVPFAKKEDAKGEGMRWDGDKKKWYHTDAGKSATSKFKKLHEEEELDEAVNISARNKRGTMSTLTGKKVGSDGEREVWAGSVKHEDGQAAAPHHVWVMHKGKIEHSIATHDAEDHKQHIAIATKKLQEEEDVYELEEGVGGYFKRTPAAGTETRAQMDKDYDKAHAAAKKDGQKPHALGYSHDKSHVNIEADGGVKSKYNLKSGELSKGHHLKEEVELDEETKKKDVKPVPGELNKMALDQHLTKHEKHFMGFDNVRAKEAIADVQKMRSTHPSKLINGIGSHLEHLKGLTGFVQGSNKKPELTEELIGEMFNRGTGHSEKDSTIKGHLVSVTVSDPNHPAVSKRDEQTEKRIRVKTGAGKDFAMKKAQSHYKKMGLKVHQVNHVKHLYEEENDFGLFAEEFNTREQAEKAMEKHEKKHPLAKHTVMQGRRSGKWHVVRHTSGGMHVIEELEDEAPILEGDESEADFQSYMKAHRAGLDHHTKQDADIDNDGKKHDPNDKYLRNRRATIAKNIAKGKK